MKKTIAKYIRISVKDNGSEESSSIVNQRYIIDNFIKSKNEFYDYEVKEFIDD